MVTRIISLDSKATNFIGSDRFLGKYPRALAAYSLREIASGRYAGPLVKVRRALDNEERDFYADHGTVNTDELAAFVGKSDGTVSVWYDQTGNGYHAVQLDPKAQPKVVSAGVLVLIGGKLSLTFDGVDDFLPIPQPVAESFKPANQAFSLFGVFNSSNAASPFTALSLAGRDSVVNTLNDLFLLQANAAFGSIPRQSAGLFIRLNGVDAKVAVSTSAPSTAPKVISGIRNNATGYVADGLLKSEATDMTFPRLNFVLATLGGTRRGIIGNLEPGAANSRLAEMVIYLNDQSDNHEDIVLNMKDYYNIS